MSRNITDNQQRQNIVRAMISSLEKLDDSNPAFIQDDDNYSDGGDSCSVTGLFFSDKLSEDLLTASDHGMVWMGLWLDCPLLLDEEGDGNTLFPRWLAEVLKEFGYDVGEENIYET